jgi:hypothetical protein
METLHKLLKVCAEYGTKSTLGEGPSDTVSCPVSELCLMRSYSLVLKKSGNELLLPALRSLLTE